MARPLRILYPGAWYHVMNRGAARRRVFLDHRDRVDFLRVLRTASEEYELEVHAYCLMGNHFHLLVRTRSANLDLAMRHIGGVYTQRFHMRHGGDGSLFRGRYRAVLVQPDRCLTVSRYIHLNPMEAKLVARPEDWPYSSLPAYLGLVRSPAWLCRSFVLVSLQTRRPEFRYQAFLREGIDDDTRTFYSKQRIGPVLGDPNFLRSTRDLAAHGTDADERTPDLARLKSAAALPLARLTSIAGDVLGLSVEKIRTPSAERSKTRGLARGAVVLAARRLGSPPLIDVAKWLHFPASAAAGQAAWRFRRAIGSSPALADQFSEILARARKTACPGLREEDGVETDPEWPRGLV